MMFAFGAIPLNVWLKVEPVENQPAPAMIPATCVPWPRSEEHTSELQSQSNLVCRLLLEKKKTDSHARQFLEPSFIARKPPSSPNIGFSSSTFFAARRKRDFVYDATFHG